MIFDQSATPAQIGAFFLAERIKMESVDELYAFVNACRSHAIRFPRPDSLDCADPYDGRKSSFMASFAAAFVLASAGLPVTLARYRIAPAQMGHHPARRAPGNGHR